MLHKFDQFFGNRFAWLLGCLLLGCGRLAALADQSVTLTWSPSTDTNAVGYKVYYGGASGVYTNTLSVGGSTNVAVTGLSMGATYYFSATTVSAAGVESAFSNEASYAIPVNTNSVTGGQLPPPSPPPAGAYPELNALPNVTIYENSGVQTIPLAGIASHSTSWNFVGIQAYTSDSTIIPAPTVNYTSPAGTGTLTFAPVANALGTATVTVTANNGMNNVSQTFTVTVVPAPAVQVSVPSQPPTLTAFTNVTVAENSGIYQVALAGITAGQPNAQTLTVSAVSSNPAVIPTPVINYSSPNGSGTLTFAPGTNAVGTSVITVSVNNGNATNNLVTQAFVVTVLGSGSPTLDPIGNVSVQEDATTQTITLIGISAGASAGRQPLRITAASNNPRVIPAPAIRYVNGGNTAVLTLRFSPNTFGQALVTVTASNGGRSNNIVRQSFTVTVSPIPPPTLDPIADVTVVTNSGRQTIALTGISAGSPIGSRVLRVTVTASNRRLPLPTATYASPATAASLTFASSSFTGVNTVTVTVSDGSRISGSVRQTFTITVVATPPAMPAGSAQPSVSVGTDVAAMLAPVANTPGQFSFEVTGVSVGKYVVQASTDMSNWTAVQTNTAPFIFQDGRQGSDRKFYRAYYLPPQAQ